MHTESDVEVGNLDICCQLHLPMNLLACRSRKDTAQVGEMR